MVGLLEKAGLGGQFFVDSAGTGDWHVGSLADPRMRRMALLRGYNLTHRARQFVAQDFSKFDFIFTMDEHNYRDVLALSPDSVAKGKVQPFSALLSQSLPRIPDPYYGQEKDFEHVLDLLEEGCGNFITSHLLKTKIG